MREHEEFENAGGKLDGINKNFTEAKAKLKQLKNEYTEEDKRLKVQHEEVQIIKERNRKIKDYINEKKRLESETGVKQNVSEKDIQEVERKIEELENAKKEADRLWKQVYIKFIPF